MTAKTILITGGCRSGKSRYALTTGQDISGSKIYLATAETMDEEMKTRIDRHRLERSKAWNTVEAPLDPVSVVKKEGDSASVILLDCLTLWISNLLLKNKRREDILKEAEKLIEASLKCQSTIIFVTNEVGAGIVPENKLARDFRDIVGEVNQTIAVKFDQVVQVVSGIPVIIKKYEPIPDSQQELKESDDAFSPIKKQGLYEAIFKRRDVRHFNSNPVDPAVLGRVLKAAHHAGSVGYMQPWNFLVIEEQNVKKKVKALFESANKKAEKLHKGERGKLYKSLKLEGILEAPVNLCVTCDRTRQGPNVLGRNTIPETDLFSAVCAVQNLWLAARAEGLGVGWVSILSVDDLKQALGIPDHVYPVAYLCVGCTDKFYEEPMLETAGWEKRLGLEQLIFYNQWNGSPKNFKVELPK